jgi:hypothetical protein
MRKQHYMRVQEFVVGKRRRRSNFVKAKSVDNLNTASIINPIRAQTMPSVAKHPVAQRKDAGLARTAAST